MKTRQAARNLVNGVLSNFGYKIVPNSLLYEWQRNPNSAPNFSIKAPLPAGAKSYLHASHPRLKDLESRYATFDRKVTQPLVWSESHIRNHDILYFRGDNAYVWQLRGKEMNVISYALSTYYTISIDKLNLLDTLIEDEYFGNYVFCIDNKNISRDLLDSILEIYFLERHDLLSKKPLNILDIGAGYGRLAHRMVQSVHNIQNYFVPTQSPYLVSFLSIISNSAKSKRKQK